MMNANQVAEAPVVCVEDVTLQYKTPDHLVTATYKVSFDIYRADRFVMLGPSGCGKSTILNPSQAFIRRRAGPSG
jgi:NitT/TauT family transport system ATP-binding protein